MSLALLGCGKADKPAATGPGRQVEGKSVETQPPNATDQKPAFAGQTRAPYAEGTPYDTVTIAKGLDHPWSLAFLPDGSYLVTERPGRLNIISREGTKTVVTGTPKVDNRDQGGLLDVAIDPEDTSIIYLSFSQPRPDGNGTALAKARLVRDGAPHLADVKVIWEMKPTLDSTKHFGSRIVFGPDSTLFLALGERSISEGRMQAQNLASHFGKIIRIHRDGSIPKDNPFVGKEGALPDIWSYGHRNIQAAALEPKTGKLWEVEHGTRGGDEINIVEKGKDYGWPTIAYGIEYRGGPITGAITQKDGMQQPIYYWDPVIAPSGMAFWNGDLYVGALAGKHVARIVYEGDKVVGEERLITDRARIRDVRVGPDNRLYLLTDEDDGELLQLVPKDGKRDKLSVRTVK
jgi:glucose/arabinose dehydrogenase